MASILCCGKQLLSPSTWRQEAQPTLSGAEMTGLEIASWEGSTQPRSTSSWCPCFHIRANDHQVQTVSCGVICNTSKSRLLSSRWVTAGCSNDELLLLSVRGTEGEEAESLHGQVGGNSSRKSTWNPWVRKSVLIVKSKRSPCSLRPLSTLKHVFILLSFPIIPQLFHLKWWRTDFSL